MPSANGSPNPFAPSLGKLLGSMPQAERQALSKAAVTLQGGIKAELGKRGSGRVYRRGNVTHQASAPGEPPAPDTGTLRASIDIEPVEKALRVGSGLKQAPALEFGTTRAGKGKRTVILPRPFMRPALEAVKDEMTDVAVGDLRASTGAIGG